MQIYRLPATLRLSPGQNFTLSVYFPLKFYTVTKHLGAHFPVESPKLFTDNLTFYSTEDEEFNIELRLFGAIPLKKLHIEVAKPPLVIPGGQAIGVLFSSKGVVIVGRLSLKGADQKVYFPARDAGVKIGDILMAIDNIPVNRVDEVETRLKNFNPEQRFIRLTVKRGNKIIMLRIKPVLCRNNLMEHRYMLGIYIEDPAAGVGTLTFYDPLTRNFAGLGHRIAEFAGKQGIPFQRGEIVLARISGIRIGLPGQPGEKIGVFNSNLSPLGKIEKNCRFGIYGKLYAGGKWVLDERPLPVAYSSQIKTGPALIYTVIKGTKVDHFKVEIVKVYRQNAPRDKGMIIKVSDPLLLKLTGGIIQGMSGSPIIQNGRLVGAVTHVLVNDPAKGYGVLAEWMIKEMNKAS